MGQGVDNPVFTSEAELSDFAEAPSVHQSKVQYVKYNMMGIYLVSGHCVHILIQKFPPLIDLTLPL